MAHTHPHVSGQSKNTDSFQAPRVKRKIVIIKRGMQMKFVMLVSVFVLIAITAIGVDFYFHFGREVQNFMDPTLRTFPIRQLYFPLKLALYMVGVTIFAIFTSRRLKAHLPVRTVGAHRGLRGFNPPRSTAGGR